MRNPIKKNQNLDLHNEKGFNVLFTSYSNNSINYVSVIYFFFKLAEDKTILKIVFLKNFKFY